MIHDVTQQLEMYGEYADVIAPAITLEELTRRSGETVPMASEPRQVIPNWAVAALAAIAVFVLIGGVAWLLGGTNAEVANLPMSVTTSMAVAPTTVPPPGTATWVEGKTVAATWSLEATYDVWLTTPVSFEGGYAALRVSGPSWDRGDIDIWLSPDGVQWEVAATQLPDPPSRLVSDGETLFVETGEGIWATRTGTAWRLVLTTEDDYAPLDYPVPFSSSVGVVAAGEAGAVAFGVDHDGRVAGWFYDGDRFVLADVGGIADLLEESTAIEVAVLDDRFVLYYYDLGGDTFERYMMVSTSAQGDAWSEPISPPEDSPLALPFNELLDVASVDGLNLVSMSWGYGLWGTDDGSSWEEIILLPAGSGWMPGVVAGELGWIVYSPSTRGTIDMQGKTASVTPAPSNSGLWYSPDSRSWAELDNSGPLDSLAEVGEFGVMHGEFLISSDEILVLAVVGENLAYGNVGTPQTEVWRLGLGGSVEFDDEP